MLRVIVACVMEKQELRVPLTDIYQELQTPSAVLDR